MKTRNDFCGERKACRITVQHNLGTMRDYANVFSRHKKHFQLLEQWKDEILMKQQKLMHSQNWHLSPSTYVNGVKTAKKPEE
uniref:Ovule protein n=1 Tax=Heterorhabditis bacteriophora TaxID=37862 RepID=A0A1I7XNQ9_HETBA